jgi:putative tryptophan/tyrosine transport system substrate-binding protein
MRDPDELEPTFAAITRERAGALLVLADPILAVHQKRIVDLAGRSRLPAIYGIKDYAAAGGLMTYGPNMADQFRRAAGHVDKILKGAKPADLPVEQPTKFEFVINLKTAKTLGLTFPITLLGRAEEVIE